MAPLRRPRMPREALERLGADRDRPLATARLTNGWAAAGVRELAVVPDAGDVLRRPWSDVDGARLDPETSELTVTWVDGAAPTVLRLADERDAALPRAVHERVQSSVVHSETVELPRGRTVRIAVRRAPDGGLLTQVLGQGRVDLADPETARAVDAAEARVRDAVGL